MRNDMSITVADPHLMCFTHFLDLFFFDLVESTLMALGTHNY